MSYDPIQSFSGDWLAATIWCSVTIVGYWVALRCYTRFNKAPVLHPILIASVIVFVTLFLVGTTLAQYKANTSILVWMLGPATIALAVPMRIYTSQLRANWRKIVLPVVVGGCLSPLLAWLFVLPLHLPEELSSSLLTKSITSPLAFATAQQIGASPSIAVFFVIIAGIFGALAGSFLFRLCNVKSDIATGIALGTVAHAVGTAQGFVRNHRTGAFASLALVVNGVLSAILIPLLVRYLG